MTGFLKLKKYLKVRQPLRPLDTSPHEEEEFFKVREVNIKNFRKARLSRYIFSFAKNTR